MKNLPIGQLISVRTVVPVWGEWLISSADFNLNHNHVNAAPKQDKYVKCKVLVSIPICEIKNPKEWYWPPNIYIIIF
jgi:hypothetical protein